MRTQLYITEVKTQGSNRANIMKGLYWPYGLALTHCASFLSLF